MKRGRHDDVGVATGLRQSVPQRPCWPCTWGGAPRRPHVLSVLVTRFTLELFSPPSLLPLPPPPRGFVFFFSSLLVRPSPRLRLAALSRAPLAPPLTDTAPRVPCFSWVRPIAGCIRTAPATGDVTPVGPRRTVFDGVRGEAVIFSPWA